MSKVRTIHLITFLYFLGALGFSFMHLVHAGHKLDLATSEAYSLPFFIDGLALIGIVLRSGSEFSKATRKLGLKVQITMGTISLAGNVFAAHNIGGMIYGVMIVTLYIFAEWLTGKVESVSVDQEREASERKAASIAKAQATRKRNATRKARENKVLEDMLKR